MSEWKTKSYGLKILSVRPPLLQWVCPGLGRAGDFYWKTASSHQLAVLFIVYYLALYPRSQSRDLCIFSLDK